MDYEKPTRKPAVPTGIELIANAAAQRKGPEEQATID